jgi:nucleotide-binding universal stress UspA family protein
MLPFRKILFPIDYSQSCEATVPYVKEMVRHFDAELTLVHAYGRDSLAYRDLIVSNQGWLKKVQNLEEERLKKFASETFPAQRLQLSVAEGEAGTVIRNVVEHEGADLVMMPTRGQGPVRRLLLGSVTAKVLHDISAAVWTGTGSVLEGHEARLPYQSVLCALDQTEEAEAVLDAAASLARSYQAQLFLLHAVVSPPMALEIDFSVYRKELMDAADFKLRELKSRLGVSAPHTVTGAAMVDAIRAEALRRKADLLVAGRGLAQNVIGRIWSNLYSIIRETPCPVISI